MFFLSRSIGTTLSREETLDNARCPTAGLKYRQLNASVTWQSVCLITLEMVDQ